eukprot:3360933-Rhodomonas_salina.5
MLRQLLFGELKWNRKGCAVHEERGESERKRQTDRQTYRQTGLQARVPLTQTLDLSLRARNYTPLLSSTLKHPAPSHPQSSSSHHPHIILTWSGPRAQLRPTQRGFACWTLIQKASVVCPESVRPDMSTMVPERDATSAVSSRLARSCGAR